MNRHSALYVVLYVLARLITTIVVAFGLWGLVVMLFILGGGR